MGAATNKGRQPNLEFIYFFKCLNESINIRFIDEDRVGISLDETTSKKDVIQLFSIFGIKLFSVTTSELLLATISGAS